MVLINRLALFKQTNKMVAYPIVTKHSGMITYWEVVCPKCYVRFGDSDVI